MTDQQTAMKRAAWVTMGIGAFFAVSALPFLHPVAHLFVQVAYWPIHEVPADLIVPAPVLIAIGGGLTTGLGGMLWALGHYVSPLSQQAAMRVTQVAAWSWFCTDSGMSILVGAPMNAVINVTFLVLMLVASRPHEQADATGVNGQTDG